MGCKLHAHKPCIEHGHGDLPASPLLHCLFTIACMPDFNSNSVYGETCMASVMATHAGEPAADSLEGNILTSSAVSSSCIHGGKL